MNILSSKQPKSKLCLVIGVFLEDSCYRFLVSIEQRTPKTIKKKMLEKESQKLSFIVCLCANHCAYGLI